jgi:hypothetical protein
VTPLADIPEQIRSVVVSVFGGTPAVCQICGQDCVIDPAIDASDRDLFYCIDCSAKASLTIKEVVEQLVAGLSISYARFVLLMDVLNAQPGTRHRVSLPARDDGTGVNITETPESETRK